MPALSLDALKRKNAYTTWVYEWDYDANNGQGDWALVANVGTIQPWTGYTLSYDNTGENVFTFEGNIVGNSNASLNFVHRGFNYFGNSFSGYVDAKTVLDQLTDEHVDGTLYMWNTEDQVFSSVTLNRLTTGKSVQSWERDIAPMQTFILQLRGANSAAESVNYASAIYGNPRHGNVGGAAPAPAHAPRRGVAERNQEVNIDLVVTATNGKRDRIRFVEGADFSDAFESGFDATKYFNDGKVNVYVSVDGEKYSDVVTNSLEGKTISMKTSDDAFYTISVEYVNNGEYALLDKETNAVIAIEEGASYEFAAQPNSTIEDRFEIIGVNKVPTAIDNTEVVKGVKGIFSITGMYMGEDFNALPAGVYVVDGVKVVK